MTYTWKEDFPIFNKNPELVYLDSAATSQRPESVIDSVREFYEEGNSNVHRGIYGLSEEATQRYEDAHRKIAALVGASSWREMVFTRNTTESINLVAYSWALKNLSEGDEILLTRMEHHSNLVPWQFVARQTGATLRFIEIDDEGELVNPLEEITDSTALVAVTHCSNVLGTINDIRSLAKHAHRHGALILVDAAQSVPHIPVDVQELDVDFLAFSGHKMCGPTGIAVLYGRRELLEEMEPFIYGGDMIRRVSYEDAEWNALPWKFEAGTPNIAGGIGLGAASDYLRSVGLYEIREHCSTLTEYAVDRLSSMSGVTVYGGSAERGPVVSFNVRGVHAHDLASLLDDRGIAIRAGHHCAQPLMGELGINACARASFYIYNTKEDVDALVDGIEHAKKVMQVE